MSMVARLAMVLKSIGFFSFSNFGVKDTKKSFKKGYCFTIEAIFVSLLILYLFSSLSEVTTKLELFK